MKNIFFLGLVIGLVLSFSPVAQANLLTNADLETGTLGQFGTGVITGWATWGPSGYYHSDYNHTTGGSRAIKTWWDDTGIFQDFAATAGTSYNIGGYVYSPTTDSLGLGWNSVLKVEWYNGATKLSEYEVGRYISGTDAAGVWKNVSGDFTAPASANDGRLVMAIVNAGTWDPEHPHTGSAGWDDLSATPIPEPTSLLLLGSGLVGLISFVLSLIHI